MSFIIKIIFFALIVYSSVNFYFSYIVNITNDIPGYKHIYQFWCYFKLPFLVCVIYFILRIKLFSRLNKTNYITNQDSFLIGTFIGTGVYLNINESNLMMVQSIAIILLAYFVWIIKRIGRVIKFRETINLLEDTPAKVDSLGRKQIADQIAITIEKAQISKAFVFAITGAWGEGKSTLMEFIITRLDKEKTVSFRFDPWFFNTQESLINNFFHSLFEKVNENRVASGTNFLISKYSSYISGVKEKEGIAFKAATSLANYSDQIEVLKEELDLCLKLLGRRIVIFIDNLDRLERKELLLIFKLVNLCSNFHNVIFVLLYDKQQILEKLNKNSHKDYAQKYLEKIIQAEIVLPKADDAIVISTWDKMLSGTLKSYIDNLSQEDKEKYNSAVFGLSSLISNLRLAKTHINWLTLKLPFLEGNQLNFVDFFILESISYYYPNVYKELMIYKKHIPYYSDYGNYAYFDGQKKVNNLRGEIFKRIIPLDDNSPQTRTLYLLLSLAFKGLKNYINNAENYWGGYIGEAKYFEKRPVDDERYYSSYFSFVPTSKLELAQTLETILNYLRQSTSAEMAEFVFAQYVSDMLKQGNESELLIHLRQNAALLEDSLRPYIIYGLTQNSTRFSYDSGFLGIGEHSNATSVVAMLLRDCSDKQIKQVAFESLVENTQELEFIRGVLYHYSHNGESVDEEFKIVQNKFSKRIKKIVSQKVNVFNDPNKYRDFWSIVDNEDIKEVQAYLKNLLEKDINILPSFFNVFVQRIISSTNGEMYLLEDEQYNNMIKYICEADIYMFFQSYIKQAEDTKELPRSILLFKKYTETNPRLSLQDDN